MPAPRDWRRTVDRQEQSGKWPAQTERLDWEMKRKKWSSLELLIFYNFFCLFQVPHWEWSVLA